MRITVTDPSNIKQGVLAEYQEATFIPRWNGVGAFSIKASVDRISAKLLVKGAGVIVPLPGSGVFSGHVDDWEFDYDGGSKVITVTGLEDRGYLGGRVVLPTPSLPYASQYSNALYNDMGALESVVKRLVSKNIGPDVSMPIRRLPGLVVATDAARGPMTTVGPLSYDNLLDTIQKLTGPASMGFTLVRDGRGGFVFDVQQTQLARGKFSTRLGNVVKGKAGSHQPGVTVALVGSRNDEVPGSTVQSFMAGTGVAPDWNTVSETYLDAGSAAEGEDPQAAIVASGSGALGGGAEANSFSVEVVDSPGMRLGVDWRLGWDVPLDIEGNTYTDTISEIKYESKPGSLIVTPTVGGIDAVYRKAAVVTQAVRSLQARVSELERRK